jgi:hypothetical protein
MENPCKKKRMMICFAAILFLATAFFWTPIQAVWQPPSTSAPNGNIAAPLNISSGSQGKLGNIGIGTISPAQKLDVAGNINMSGTTSRTIFFGTTGVAAPGAGSIGEKIQLYGTSGTIGSSDYAIGVESSTMWFNTSGLFKWYKNSSVEMILDASGNLGIGTTPTQKLDVAGSLRGTGSLLLNNDSPTVYFQDTDSYSGMIHVNGNLMYILTGSGNNSTSWTIHGSYWPLTVDMTSDALMFGGSASFMEGSVGIGTNAPWAPLSVVGKSAFTRDGVAECCSNDATIGLGESTSSTGRKASISFHNGGVSEGTFELNGSGERRFIMRDNQGALMGLETTGNIRGLAFFYTSDASLKKDIAPIDGSIGKICLLNGVYFKWKDSGDESMGLIAQDVEKIFPEAVSTNSETGLKSVDYGKLVAPLIEAVKAQQLQIQHLKQEIDDLKQNGI